MRGVATMILSALLLGLWGGASAQQGFIRVDDPSLMKEAIDFTNIRADIDTIYLTVPGGVYTTHDTLFYEIKQPTWILAWPGLPEKPIITHSDDSSSVLEMFRIYNDLTVEGVVFDGGRAETHGMKYALRVGNSPDGTIMAKKGLNITVRNCDFINIAQDKDPLKQGNAIYFLRDINTVGKVLFENCYFENISDEAIRMTETEKYKTDRCLDTLIVRNSTFVNNGSECIRFYADTDEATQDAYVLIENLTIYNSATRVAYIKNNWGTIFRNVIVMNSHLSVRRQDRNDYVIEIQRPGSVLSHIDTLNMVFTNPSDRTLRATKDGTEMVDTFWGFDPKFADPENGDFTLLPESHAYYAAHDGGALGDRRWATNTPTVIPFFLEIEGQGTVQLDPPIDGRSYDPGTVVTLTAVPDSGWVFAEWSGDLSGTQNPATVTVDAAKNITAKFAMATAVEEADVVPQEYRLEQNFPNPFNPQTTISFVLKKSGMVTLKIYDILGQERMTVVHEKLTAGQHTVTVDAQALPSGLYFYKLASGSFEAVRKMVVTK